MPIRRIFLASLVGSLALLFAAVAAIAEQVEFKSIDGKSRLRAFLFLPDSEPPHRAVVFLHGCSGVGLGGGLSATYSSWARHFNGHGYAVLVVDSAGSRGFASTCGGGERRRTMYAKRPGDAYSALRYLQAQPFIHPDRIALMGWSQGGGITLLTVVSQSIGRPAPPPEHDFKAAVALYPSACSLQWQHTPFTEVQRGHWRTDIPLLILHGAKDNWTRPEPCQKFVEELQGRGQPVLLHIYPDAVHSFDAPRLRLQQRSGPVLADGSRPWLGTDAKAREDALQRVPEFFGGHMPAH